MQYFILETDCVGISKARVHTWLDHGRDCAVYGVQVKIKDQPHRFFSHVLRHDRTPILFDSEDKAYEFMEKLIAADKD